MTPHLSVQKARPEFDAFLFAAIGEERNGMTLSVLSGLSRLNLDPWEEAVRLSRLPRQGAVEALGHSIARLPRGKWQLSDVAEIASRLVALLPRADLETETLASKPAQARQQGNLVLWLIAAGLALALLLGVAGRVERLMTGDGPATPVHRLSNGR
jgi:hypothetical protein